MWTNRPTYEEILGQLSKDYVVKLPDRVALKFYDSFTMGQFREQQVALRGHGSQADLHREEAMGSAAEENGMTKREFMHFAAQVHQQSAGGQCRTAARSAGECGEPPARPAEASRGIWAANG